MADVDLRGPSKHKKTGLRRPRRRVGVRVDMTPMVDIAFLLLIFYMVTTLFSAPKAMEISLPPDKKTEVEIQESNLLFLRVDKDSKIYRNFGIKGAPEPIPLDSLRTFLYEKNIELPKMVTFIKIDKDAKYHVMVDIIDEIQIVESKLKEKNPEFSYRFSVASMDEFDKKQMERVLGPAGGGQPTQ